MRGVLSVSGVIGTWAGPRSAGHGVRDGPPQDRRRRRRQARRVGLPRGRDGRGDPRARRRGPSVRRDGAHRDRRRADPRARRPRPRRRHRDRRGDRRRRRDRGDPSADHVPPPARPGRPARRVRRRPAAVEDAQRHGEGEPRARPPARVHRRARLRPRRPRRHDRARTEPRPRGAGVPGRGRGPAGGRAVRRRLHPVGVRPDARARGQARDVDVHAVGAERVVAGAAPRRARRVRGPRRRRDGGRRARASPTRSCTAR